MDILVVNYKFNGAWLCSSRAAQAPACGDQVAINNDATGARELFEVKQLRWEGVDKKEDTYTHLVSVTLELIEPEEPEEEKETI